MSTDTPDLRRLEDPDSRLEQAFEEEFLRARGYDPNRMSELGKEELNSLRKEACAYASAKLAEIQCRAYFIHELHGLE